MELDEARGPVINEVRCKSVLNRGGIDDYSLNCYTGCAHACAYCYARYMQRFHPHAEAWGDFVDVKVNAPDALAKQLRRAAPGAVFMSSACDGWQPVEEKYRLTRECCCLLLDHGFSLNILTKNARVQRDFDLFEGRPAQVGMTITTLDEKVAARWEPGASPVAERVETLRKAKEAGLRTCLMFAPMLPFLYDDQRSVDALMECAAELNVDTIWTDTLNLRPKVWESVRELLRQDHPGLLERYHRVLFVPQIREAYTRALRERFARAAHRLHLTDRLSGCA